MESLRAHTHTHTVWQVESDGCLSHKRLRRTRLQSETSADACVSIKARWWVQLNYNQQN